MTTILLIDDDPLITGPLVKTLEQSGYQVMVADNGRDGLAQALQTEPELVVLDILLPEMDGWDVCRELRRHSAVPILMLTALPSTSFTGIPIALTRFVSSVAFIRGSAVSCALSKSS